MAEFGSTDVGELVPAMSELETLRSPGGETEDDADPDYANWQAFTSCVRDSGPSGNGSPDCGFGDVWLDQRFGKWGY